MQLLLCSAAKPHACGAWQGISPAHHVPDAVSADHGGDAQPACLQVTGSREQDKLGIHLCWSV